MNEPKEKSEYTRDEVLSSLINSGWGDIKQTEIPAHVMKAAEEGLPVPKKMNCRSVIPSSKRRIGDA